MIAVRRTRPLSIDHLPKERNAAPGLSVASSPDVRSLGGFSSITRFRCLTIVLCVNRNLEFERHVLFASPSGSVRESFNRLCYSQPSTGASGSYVTTFTLRDLQNVVDRRD